MSKLTDQQRKTVAHCADILDGLPPAKQDRRDVFQYHLNRLALQLLYGTAAETEPAPPGKHPLCDAEVAKPGYGTSIKSQLVPLAFAHDLEDRLTGCRLELRAAMEKLDETQGEHENTIKKLNATGKAYHELLKTHWDSAWFQNSVGQWLHCCFDNTTATSKSERNHRFLEEALELVQSLGCTMSETTRLVEYVFGRPAGEPKQEVGGVLVTLAALCHANRIQMYAAGEAELLRIKQPEVMEKIRAKQAAKPKLSPLPGQPHADLCAAVRAGKKIEWRPPFLKSDRWVACDVTLKQVNGPGPVFAFPRDCFRIVEPTESYDDLLAAIREGKTIEWSSNPSTGPWVKCPVNKSDLGKAVNEVFVDKRIHYRIVAAVDPFQALVDGVAAGGQLQFRKDGGWALAHDPGVEIDWLVVAFYTTDHFRVVPPGDSRWILTGMAEQVVRAQRKAAVAEPKPYAGPPEALVKSAARLADELQALTASEQTPGGQERLRLRLLRYRAAVADGWRFTVCPHVPNCWYVTENKRGVVLSRTFDSEWEACWKNTPDYPCDAAAVAAAVARLPQQKQERFGWLLRDKTYIIDPKWDFQLACNRMALSAATAPAAVLCEAYVEAAEEGLTPVAK